MKKHLLVANWKMNPLTEKEAVSLLQEVEKGVLLLRNVEITVAPPAIFLLSLLREKKRINIAAQNLFWKNQGAFTGEISPLQAKKMDVNYTILGHSERRINLGETNEMINKKMRAAIACGLKVILCVGESEREEGEISAIVEVELTCALKGISKKELKNIIVAYEPVWAISTNKSAHADTPDNAFRANLFIRKIVAKLYDRKCADEICVIYGGSVRSANIASFLEEGKMQGALVGGASLNAQEFIEIASIISRMQKHE